MKISQISTKVIIWFISIIILLLILSCVIYKRSYHVENIKQTSEEIASKQALEVFINHQMNRHDRKYTVATISPLLTDEKSSIEDIASDISEKSDYFINTLKVTQDKAYYTLGIPTEHPSESEPDFILPSYFKLIKKDNKWEIDKICRACHITDF